MIQQDDNAPHAHDNAARKRRPRVSSLFSRLGATLAVSFALVCALASFLILAVFQHVDQTSTLIYVVNIVAMLILLGLVVAEGRSLIAAQRAGMAAAGFHLRIVRVFAILAAAPAVIVALSANLALDKIMDRAFLQKLSEYIVSTGDVAAIFSQSQCLSLVQVADLTAADLDLNKSVYQNDKLRFQEIFRSRARNLGFNSAALISDTGVIIFKADVSGEMSDPNFNALQKSDFEDARRGEPICIVHDDAASYIVVRPVSAFPNAFLYVSRPIDAFTRDFPKNVVQLNAEYRDFEASRNKLIWRLAAMFGLLVVIMLLTAMIFGLDFANKLVAPIGRLISAADEVSAGNLAVRVPINVRDGDLAHLGETFNNMTSELRSQHQSLVAASEILDQRRAFTEAVLSGVPAAVLGVDGDGIINVANPSAARIALGQERADHEEDCVGRPLSEVVPEIAAALTEAAANERPAQAQISLLRGGRERIVNARVTPGAQDQAGRSFVVTLDDITDLVTAQRTSAWADVARRIAHEIKNPLTPIQLSAERLKRKYGRVITQDREIFDQCTDTIVRQVDDIKRMVDEFSSFARMPKARPSPDDLVACARQVAFLQRVGTPDVALDENYESDPLICLFDRRLMAQALTNVLKNAGEGVIAAAGANGPGRIVLRIGVHDDRVAIDVIDNGLGFPQENRQRLLEPYVTTRAEGTGLGLPIVAKILEEHGGGIELLDSPFGAGAHVRLFFPLGRMAKDDDHAPSSAENADPARSLVQPRNDFAAGALPKT